MGISASRRPAAIFAATRAIGYPVALEARAEDRDTRGLTSMTKYSWESGARANCTLQPPAMPSALMIRSAALRSCWYSRSVSVCEGATTMESPVCTPIGSRFSMLQTVMQVPDASRITSYSISLQPTSERSTSTWPIGEAARPEATVSVYCASLSQIPPPVPPRVKAGRTTRGSPSCSRNARPSAGEETVAEAGTGSPISTSSRLKSSRSSAARMARSGVPRSRTRLRSSTPASSRAMARLSPVWPPRVASRPSGRSRSMIRSSTGTVSGST